MKSNNRISGQFFVANFNIRMNFRLFSQSVKTCFPPYSLTARSKEWRPNFEKTQFTFLASRNRPVNNLTTSVENSRQYSPNIHTETDRGSPKFGRLVEFSKQLFHRFPEPHAPPTFANRPGSITGSTHSVANALFYFAEMDVTLLLINLHPNCYPMFSMTSEPVQFHQPTIFHLY